MKKPLGHIHHEKRITETRSLSSILLKTFLRSQCLNDRFRTFQNFRQQLVNGEKVRNLSRKRNLQHAQREEEPMKKAKLNSLNLI